MRLPFTETKTFNSHFLIIINFVVKQFLKHKTFVHCFHCDSMCTHERDLYKVVKHIIFSIHLILQWYMCVTTILQSILYYFNIPHTDIVGNSGQTPKKESTREMLSNNKSQGGHWRIQTQQDTGQPAAATVLQCYSNNSFEARMTSCSSSASHLLHLSLSHKHTYFQPGPSQHYCRYPDFSPRTALIMTLLCWDEEGENGF